MPAHPYPLKKAAKAYFSAGHSYTQTAKAFSIPVGTLKAWAHREGWRHENATTSATTARSADGKGHATPVANGSLSHGPIVSSSPQCPKCRGVTRYDLPGKTLVEKSINFRNLQRGTYPPGRWKIPSTLEGQPLLDAIAAATRKKTTP